MLYVSIAVTISVMTTPTMIEDVRFCYDELQFVTHPKQYDQSNKTTLCCTLDESTNVCRISELASKVKALCKCVAVTGTAKELNEVLTMALDSMQLQKTCSYSRLGPVYRCDLMVNGICISIAEANKKKVSLRSASVAAVRLLQMPYLHLKAGANSASVKTLAGSENALQGQSYDVVTELDVSSIYLSSPSLDLINVTHQQNADSKLHQLVVCLKQVVSAVRTIVHILRAPDGSSWIHGDDQCKKVIVMALHVVKASVRLHPDNVCTLSLYGVDVTVAEAGAATEHPYTDAVQLLCNPCLYLIGSWRGRHLRLVASEEEGLEVAVSSTSPFANWIRAGSEQPHVVHQERALPDHVASANVAETNSHCQALDSSDIPPVIVSLCRLSDVLRKFSEGMTDAGSTDADVMQLALKNSGLSYYTDVSALDHGRRYRCDLWICCVLVASGEAAGCATAIDAAYARASQLLRKPHLHWAEDASGSEVLLGSDDPFIDLPSPTSYREQATISTRPVDETLADLCHAVQMEQENVKVGRPSSQSAASDMADAVREPVTAASCGGGGGLFALPAHLDTFASRVKVESAHKFNNSVHLIRAALAYSRCNFAPKLSFSGTDGVASWCELSLGDVLISVGHAKKKKLARRAAHNAAVQLLNLPYLALEEVSYRQYKLIGSDEPLVVRTAASHDGAPQWKAHRQQCDNANTTSLSCAADNSASVSGLSVLASKVKALCKCLTARGTVLEQKDMLTLALDSMRLLNVCSYSQPGHGSMHQCDIMVNDVCISVGNARKKIAAKRLACSAAVRLLRMPYLHLKAGTNSASAKTLAGSENALQGQSYDVVTELDISSSYLSTPSLDLINVTEQQNADSKLRQLVICLKRVVSAVRTVVHILRAPDGSSWTQGDDNCKKMVVMALRVAKAPARLRTVGGCVFSVGGLDIALTDAGSTSQHPYTDIVELLCKPSLCVVSSQNDGRLRLLGFEEYALGEGDDGLLMLRCDLVEQEGDELEVDDDTTVENSSGVRCDSGVSVAAVHRVPGSVAAAENDEFVSSEAGDDGGDDDDDCENLRQSREGSYRAGIFATQAYSQLSTTQNSDDDDFAVGCDSESLRPPTIDEKQNVTRRSKKKPSTPTVLDEFVMLRGDFRRQSAVKILKRSAIFNSWSLRFVIDGGAEGSVRCSVVLGEHTVASATGCRKMAAKKAAAEQALKQLAVTCYALETKKFNTVAKPLTRTQVCLFARLLTDTGGLKSINTCTGTLTCCADV